jgi:hypothetical protein
MKTKLILALILISLGGDRVLGSEPEIVAAKKQKAVMAVHLAVVRAIAPVESMRAMMSRRVVLPTMWYEPEILDENSEAPGEFALRIRERHRSVGKKAHPRDGLIVLTGYYQAGTGDIYLFDRLSRKHVPADRHPRVVAGKAAKAKIAAGPSIQMRLHQK